MNTLNAVIGLMCSKQLHFELSRHSVFVRQSSYISLDISADTETTGF